MHKKLNVDIKQKLLRNEICDGIAERARSSANMSFALN